MGSNEQWRNRLLCGLVLLLSCCVSSGTFQHAQIRLPWLLLSSNRFKSSLKQLSSTGSVEKDDHDQYEAPVTEFSKKVTAGGRVSSSLSLKFTLHTSIREIAATDWDACLTSSTSSPFLQHAWLSCLEESGCASSSTGWIPRHVSVRNSNNTVIGYVVLYMKTHSMGEFIFDDAFAECAYQNGIPYYPKLLNAVPFTPVCGERTLWRPEYCTNDLDRKRLRLAVASFLKQLVNNNRLSSVHCNFLTDAEATDISGPFQKKSLLSLLRMPFSDTYLRRTSLQYHWINIKQNHKNETIPFVSFDDYLSCFKSKRRISIKRERQSIRDQNITIHAIQGLEIRRIPGLVERMYRIYQSTVDKKIYGQLYLNLDFFERLVQSDFCHALCFLVCIRQQSSNKSSNNKNMDVSIRAEDIFAGTFNIVKDGVFYGRYWGCLEFVKNLHFECCYWAAIDYCIQHRLHRMEPGAGGGDYKWTRGFDPVLIHSVHYICHPGLRRAISNYLDYETEDNVELTNYLMERSAVRVQPK